VSLPIVELKELSSVSDFLGLRFLRVKPEQRRFTKNLLVTFLQARHPAVTAYSLHWQGKLVGYVMLVHAEQPTQWIIERLTIDGPQQGQGLAYAAADKLIDMIHGFENSEMVIARYSPENEAARGLFQKLRFVEREEMFRGRLIAVLEFEFEDDGDDDDEYDEQDEAAAEEDPAAGEEEKGD